VPSRPRRSLIPEDRTADPKENIAMTLFVTVPPHSHISVALRKYACSFCDETPTSAAG
jgi:hypothetical protein